MHPKFKSNAFSAKDEITIKSRRRGQATGVPMLFRIDGKAWTIKECLERSGMDESIFRRRVTKVRGLGHPLTWEAICR